MDRRLLDFILEVHSEAENYNKIEILQELLSLYPQWTEVYDMILEEGICPNCYGYVMSVGSSCMSYGEEPLVFYQCTECDSRF